MTKEIDGKSGGKFHWEPHDFIIILPQDCTDEKVKMQFTSYIPEKSNTIISTVFDIKMSTKKFKKPITIHLPHCVNITNELELSKLVFIVQTRKYIKFVPGIFEIGSCYGTLQLSEFCKIGIVHTNCLTTSVQLFKSVFSSCLPAFSSSVLIIPLSSENEHIKEPNKIYSELLFLPLCRHQISHWTGLYCITPNNPSYIMVNHYYYYYYTYVNCCRLYVVYI